MDERIRLVAATSREPQKRERITGAMGFDKAYADVDEMLDNERPDLVFLCVGQGHAADFACRVLKRGLPLVMEKPVGRGPAEGRRVADAARDADVPNMVLFNRRFNPLLVRARHIAAERGAHTVAQYRFDWHRCDVAAPRSMMGSALHMIDAIRFLAGDVTSLNGVGSPVRYFDGAMTASCFLLNFENGAIGSFAHSVRSGRAYEQYRVIGENWTVAVSIPPPSRDDSRWWLQLEEADHIVERIDTDRLDRSRRHMLWKQGFAQETEHFVECLEQDRRPKPDIPEAVRSMELAQEFLRAVAPPEQVDEL
jgi:predicted dehydrogenase